MSISDCLRCCYELCYPPSILPKKTEPEEVVQDSGFPSTLPLPIASNQFEDSDVDHPTPPSTYGSLTDMGFQVNNDPARSYEPPSSIGSCQEEDSEAGGRSIPPPTTHGLISHELPQEKINPGSSPKTVEGMIRTGDFRYWDKLMAASRRS